MAEKVLRLKDIEPWKENEFRSFSKEKAIEIFQGICIVPDEWRKVYVLSDEDFQVALQCVNSAIEAARHIEAKLEEAKKVESTPPSNVTCFTF